MLWKLHKGVLQAKSEIDVEYVLENQGFDLISCQPFKRRKFRVSRGSIPRRELINMVFS